MKKIILIFLMMLSTMSIFAGTNSVSGNHIVFNEDVGFDSVGVYSDVTVSYPNFRTYLIFKAVGDTIWKSGPSSLWVGSGFIYNSIHNLSPSTTYEFKLVFWKVGQPNDTSSSNFTVKTKSTPPTPVFSVVAAPGLDTSTLEIWVTNANGYYPAISARYGPGLTSKTDTVRNKTGNFIATIKLYTPTPNTVINYYIKYDVDTSFPVSDTFYSGSFTTPSVDRGHITATSVDNIGIDSAQLSVVITKGSYNGNLKFLIQDSTTQSYVQTSPTTSITSSGTYSYRSLGLSSEHAYYAVFIYADRMGSDTVRVLFRTKSKPKLAAPTIIGLPSGHESVCGVTTFTGGVSVSLVAGDTAKGILIRSNDGGITFVDTVLTRSNVTTSTYSTGNLALSTPMSSHHYYWAFDWYSKDNLKNRIMLDANTPTGDSPNVLASFVGMNTQTNPSISFGGYGGCDATIAYVYVVNNLGDTVFRATVDVGPDQFNKTLALPNLPEGTYRLIVNVINQNGSDLDEDVQIRRLITGITEQSTQKLIYDPYLQVRIYGEMGELLGSGIWGDIHNWLIIPNQINIITICAIKDNTYYSVRRIWTKQP